MKKVTFILILFVLLTNAAMPAYAEQIYGAYTDTPPFAFQHNNEPDGFNIKLLRTMLTLDTMKGVDVTMKYYPFKRSFVTVLEEKDHFALIMARTPEREDSFKWVGPVYPRLIALYRLRDRSDLHITKIDDVMKYRIGAVRGQSAKDNLLKAGIGQEQIDEVTTMLQNVKKLFTGRVDFVVSNDLIFMYTLQEGGRSSKDIEKALTIDDDLDFYFGFNKETDDRIVHKFQQALDQLKQNGEYQKILNQYITSE